LIALADYLASERERFARSLPAAHLAYLGMEQDRLGLAALKERPVPTALPLAALLIVQVLFVAVLAPPIIFRLMGRDHDAAVMSSGFIGFMLGTTANAMANMEALTERYGPAPRAFLVVPMVGAFFIDVVNNVVITAFLNVYR